VLKPISITAGNHKRFLNIQLNNFMKKPLLLFAFLLSCLSTYAQWEEIGQTIGFYGLSSYQTPLNYILVNTSTVGLGRSQDNGLTFQSTNIPVVPNAMMVQHDTLYVAGYYGAVLYSTDLGATTTSIEGGTIQNKGVEDMVPYKADKILVGSRKDGVQVYNKTTQTWTRIGYAGKEVSCVLAKGDTIFAGVQYDGVYMSTNNGSTWTLSYETYSNGPQDMIVYNGKILLGTYGTGVKISQDNGANWSNFNVGLPNTFVASRFCLSKDNHLFVCGYGGGVYHYNKSLQSWANITANLPETTTEQMVVSDTFLFVTTGVNSKKLFRRLLTTAIVAAPVPNPEIQTLQVMPNPSSDQTTLSFEGSIVADGTPVQIKVTDVSGRVRYDQTHPGAPQISIGVRNWPAGVYFLTATAAERVIGKTVVVKQ
jgi:photosystem II stability/assembly factor-like uncharacterized protein